MYFLRLFCILDNLNLENTFIPNRNWWPKLTGVSLPDPPSLVVFDFRSWALFGSGGLWGAGGKEGVFWGGFGGTLGKLWGDFGKTLGCLGETWKLWEDFGRLWEGSGETLGGCGETLGGFGKTLKLWGRF